MLNKQIPTTIGILIVIFLAGLAAGFVFFLRGAEEGVSIKKMEEIIIDKKNKELEEIVLVDKIMVPVIDFDTLSRFGEEIAYDTDDMKKAKERGDYVGCGDKVAYIEKKIEPTSRPLKAIYLELFKGDEIVEGTDYINPLSIHIEKRFIDENIIEPLRFEKVIIEDNIAKVYLSGNYVTVGTCEPPRTEAVLRFASLQYPWIKGVEIYLNGKEMEFIHGGKG